MRTCSCRCQLWCEQQCQEAHCKQRPSAAAALASHLCARTPPLLLQLLLAPGVAAAAGAFPAPKRVRSARTGRGLQGVW